MKFKYFIAFIVSSSLLYTSCDDEMEKIASEGKQQESLSVESSSLSLAVNQAIDFVSGLNRMTRSDNSLTVVSVYPWLTRDIMPSTRASFARHFPDTLLYIVNFSDNNGYVLVSANQPRNDVVAYIEEGNLSPHSPISNPGLQFFLDALLDYADTIGLDPQPYNPPIFPPAPVPWTIDTLYTPLLTTKWGQSSPFNLHCPIINDNHAPAGCVAIALGQIFSKHRKPLVYQSYSYKWSEILTGDIPTTEVGRESVATLISDIGVLVNMNYGSNSSSAYSFNVPICFNTFNYLYNQIDKYDFDICKNSIKYGMPIYVRGTHYAGSSFSGIGHAWVIDGCLVRHTLDDMDSNAIDTQRYVHCNWGWNGIANGYFLSGVFATQNRILDDNGEEVENTYSTDRSYIHQMAMYYDIRPVMFTPM